MRPNQTLSRMSEPLAAIRINAVRLPANEEVPINVGIIGSGSETVARARTGADGSLTQTGRLPTWLTGGKRVVITVTDDQHNVLGRSVSSARFR